MDLILNQFITPNHLNLGNNVKSYDISTSEVLSNQLGNMISSFTDEFDIGFNYTLGNQLSNEEYRRYKEDFQDHHLLQPNQWEIYNDDLSYQSRVRDLEFDEYSDDDIINDDY